MSSHGALAVCQSGFEGLLLREMEALGLACVGKRAGLGAAQPADTAGGQGLALRAAAFPHAILESPTARSAASSVNELAQGVMDLFADSLRGERIEARVALHLRRRPGRDRAWPAGRRRSRPAFRELLRKKLGRLAKLAVPGEAAGRARRAGSSSGSRTFGRRRWRAPPTCAASAGWPTTTRRPRAPTSRSRRPTAIIGAEPAPGETVCDLGAAPGGWSYSAAKRGARVVAVDNGPLKGGALGNPLIDHRRADAFGFSPGKDAVYDWLFSDMLEDPHKVLQSIVRPWLSGGWCRRFVVNLKFGRVDPIALLADLRAPDSPFAKHADRRQDRPPVPRPRGIHRDGDVEHHERTTRSPSAASRRSAPASSGDAASIVRLFFDRPTSKKVGLMCRALASARARSTAASSPRSSAKIADSIHHGGIVAVVEEPRRGSAFVRPMPPRGPAGARTSSSSTGSATPTTWGPSRGRRPIFGVPRHRDRGRSQPRPGPAPPPTASPRAAWMRSRSAPSPNIAPFLGSLAAAGYDVVGAATRGGAINPAPVSVGAVGPRPWQRGARAGSGRGGGLHPPGDHTGAAATLSRSTSRPRLPS